MHDAHEVGGFDSLYAHRLKSLCGKGFTAEKGAGRVASGSIHV
jgi:hypothetical protein